ncbi:hypothetical protein AOLI_G00102040 [Acnodon oligacanthus]
MSTFTLTALPYLKNLKLITPVISAGVSSWALYEVSTAPLQCTNGQNDQGTAVRRPAKFGCKTMIEAEASLHEKDADIDQLLENERLEKAAAEAEAQAIQELTNIHLDEAEEKEENHLAADETTEAFLTEAEVEAVTTITLQYIDQREAELLGCEVISFADTEPEAPTVTTQTFMDEVDTPTVHPLAEEEMFEVMDTEDHLDSDTEDLGNESHEDADVEVEAEDRNTLTDTQLDDTKATFSQTLAEIEILKKDTPEIDTRKCNPNSTNFISSGEEACFEIYTCHGAPISDLSMVPDEDEVLMPPHELFESEKLSTWPELSDCKAVHKLTSKGKKSNMKCEYVNFMKQQENKKVTG